MIASAVQAVLIPVCGMLSDRVGRKPVYAVGITGSTLSMAPFFLLTDTGETGWVLGRVDKVRTAAFAPRSSLAALPIRSSTPGTSHGSAPCQERSGSRRPSIRTS
jgi:MFS family permease